MRTLNKTPTMLRTILPCEPSELLSPPCQSKSPHHVVSSTGHSDPCHDATIGTRSGRGTWERPTDLSVAVRSRAPRHVIQELLYTNIDQLGVLHSTHGTILHEAFKYRVEDGALEELVHAAVHSDQRRPLNEPALLEQTDELGRTALHYMIDRIVRDLDGGGESTSPICRNLLRMLVESCPSTVGTIDADGSTPLVLLLLVPRFNVEDRRGRQCEEEIFHMVRIMVDVCPDAVKVARILPRPWHYRFKFESCNDGADDRHRCLPSFLHGDGLPSPLSCAILQSRSLDTLGVLLKASRHLDSRACSAVVTHLREIPLHVAVSLRAPVDVLESLISEEPRTVNVPDVHGLLPLDWVWIRHTIDFCSWPIGRFPPLVPSRRRYIITTFLEWHERVSNHYLGISTSMESSPPDPTFREAIRERRLDLLTRMTALLPIMATQSFQNDSSMMADENAASGFSQLLHAACAVRCPLALVAMACEVHPGQLCSRDEHLDRLPLHYASTRSGYMAHFLVGVTNQLQGVEEVSPVFFVLAKYPSACRVADRLGQLPLHIAIDHAKVEARRRYFQRLRSVELSDAPQTPGQCSTRSYYKPVDAILSHYPEALQRRDGVTRLYPFQQAAEGVVGDTELCFLLLRRDPTLIMMSPGKTVTSITEDSECTMMCEPPSFIR